MKYWLLVHHSLLWRHLDNFLGPIAVLNPAGAIAIDINSNGYFDGTLSAAWPEFKQGLNNYDTPLHAEIKFLKSFV